MYYSATCPSPLGAVTLAADGGSLTGYAGGIGAKIKLLELEGADMLGLFVPE